MTQLTINIGASENDRTGDNLRDSFSKVNDNFAELYASDNYAYSVGLALLNSNNLGDLSDLTTARINLNLASTTGLDEGSNLYWTNSRFDDRMTTTSIGALSDVNLLGLANDVFLKYNATNSEFYVAPVEAGDLSGSSTSDLAEGTNLYYTDTRFDTRFALTSLSALVDVPVPGAPEDGDFLAYDNGSGLYVWTPAPGTGTVTSITAGAGLLGGIITASGTLDVDTGTTANKIVVLDGSGLLPAVDGSQLTNLPGAGVNAINDTMIDWGSGANQVDTDDVPEGSSNFYMNSAGVAALLTYNHSSLYIISSGDASSNSGAPLAISAGTLGFNVTDSIYYTIYSNRQLMRPAEVSANLSTGELTFATGVLLENDEIEAVYTTI